MKHPHAYLLIFLAAIGVTRCDSTIQIAINHKSYSQHLMVGEKINITCNIVGIESQDSFARLRLTYEKGRHTYTNCNGNNSADLILNELSLISECQNLSMSTTGEVETALHGATFFCTATRSSGEKLQSSRMSLAVYHELQASISTTQCDTPMSYWTKQRVTIRCTASQHPRPIGSITINAEYKNEFFEAGCAYEDGAVTNLNELSDMLGWDPISRMYCRQILKAIPYSLEISGPVTNEIDGTTMRCSVQLEGNERFIESSSVLIKKQEEPLLLYAMLALGSSSFLLVTIATVYLIFKRFREEKMSSLVYHLRLASKFPEKGDDEYHGYAMVSVASRSPPNQSRRTSYIPDDFDYDMPFEAQPVKASPGSKHAIKAVESIVKYAEVKKRGKITPRKGMTEKNPYYSSIKKNRVAKPTPQETTAYYEYPGVTPKKLSALLVGKSTRDDSYSANPAELRKISIY